MGEREIETFLTYLAVKRNAVAFNQNAGIVLAPVFLQNDLA